MSDSAHVNILNTSVSHYGTRVSSRFFLRSLLYTILIPKHPASADGRSESLPVGNNFAGMRRHRGFRVYGKEFRTAR